MSASTSKKNRAAELSAGPTKKQLAVEKEAAAKAKSKRNRSIISVVVAIVIVVVLLFNTGVLYTGTNAVKIGGEGYSPAVVQYYLASQYYNFVNQYGSYASIFGLNTNGGISSLEAQPCSMLGDDGTWKDYFMDAGIAQLTQVKAMLDYAKDNGITLDADDTAYIDAQMAALGQAAETNDLSVKNFLKAYYGGDISEKLVRRCVENDVLADKAYAALANSFEYSEAELEEYYAGLNGASDTYTYAYYNVAAATEETTDADGNTVTAVNADTMKAAKADADAIVKAFKDAPAAEVTADNEALRLKEEAEAASAMTDNFKAAVASVIDEASATATQTSGESLSSVYADWLMGSRKAGDITVVENADATGYIVVLFVDHNDNHYKTASVRHILVKAASDSDSDLAAAYKEASAILNTWKSGAADEESFAALANEKSEDEGSNTNGGLYENIIMGSTVPAFDAFCYGGHKPGDTAIVYGNNGQYAGYHVMYYVGESEQLYSSVLAENDLVSTAVNEYMSSAVAALNADKTFFAKLV